MDTRPLAVVTGASSGIGYELAKQFADNGFDLVTEAVAKVEGPDIVTDSGTRYTPDVIILATGFEAGKMLAPMDIRGRFIIDPESGKLLAFLAVPTDEVTNCAFGGDDLKTLCITGGGTLYSIRS